MLIFAILIVISIVMYIYYKVAILKTKETLLQKYQNAKARIFLGSQGSSPNRAVIAQA